MKKILIIAAHPDDEVLGCGATIAKLAKKGNIVYCLILGEGKTSRSDKRNRALYKKDLLKLKSEMKRSGKILGIKKFITYDLPDNRFDSLELLDIVKKISTAINKIRPNVIFTHFKDDLNIDHRLTYRATITA